MNNLFKLLLVVAAGALAFLCYESIVTPIEFNEVRDAREKVIVERLIDIRRAETEYRNIKGDYTASFDTLINFIKNDKAVANLVYVIRLICTWLYVTAIQNFSYN